MVLSDYSKLRILSLHWRGYKVSTIVDHLVLEVGIRASMQGVRQFLKRYGNHGTITRKPGSGLPGKLAPSAKMMTRLLHSCISTYGLYVSLTTILRNRHQLGWVYRGSAYCQLIRQANKQKQLDWAHSYLHDSFDDVIWSNETTVQLESHRRFSYRKEGEKPCPNPVQNILSKYMFGQELLRMGQVQFAFSKEWMLHCTVKYSNGRSYPLFKRSFHH